MKETLSLPWGYEGYRWLSVGEAHAVLVLVHGMAETIERYDDFANFLSHQGVAVYGYNQRGHGEHAEQLGYLGENGWKQLVEDLKEVVSLAKSEHLSLPLFIMGHSMGSFVVRSFLTLHANMVDGVILSGTGFISRLALFGGTVVSANLVLKHGPKFVSPKVDQLVFGKSNRRISTPSTPFDWLSRDPKVVEEYIADPYCGAMHPVSFFYEMMSGVKFLEFGFHGRFDRLPMYFISGDADPVGNYGKGVKRAEKYYAKRGAMTSITLYPEARHEILNECNRAEVYEDVINFIKALLINWKEDV